MNRKLSFCFAAVLMGIVFFTGAALALDNPYDGWWYTPGKEGTGVSIEIQDSTLFLALYFFDGSGQSTWLTSGGPISEASAYSGILRRFSGGLPNPDSQEVGSLQVTFESETQATLFWTYQGQSGSLSLTKFMDANFPGVQDIRDIQGWWWDPAQAGMGFFVEVQGNTLFMAWYQYRSDGTPVWYTAGSDPGAFTDQDTHFAGLLLNWQDGQTLGGAYKSPTSSVKSSVSINFNDDSSMTFSWNGDQYNLTRFPLGSSPEPQPAPNPSTGTAYWTVMNQVCCLHSDNTFKATVEGVTLQMTNTRDCGAFVMPPAYEPVTAGSKNITWSVSAGCETAKGSRTVSMEDGKCYYVVRSINGSGRDSVDLVLAPSCF